MKALILAAGLGTRLQPYTLKTPKPLFPIFGKPNLDMIIRKLEAAGCDAVIVNTHHLPHKIEEFLSTQKYTIPVITKYEAKILGTGGAIKNLSAFWGNDPFFVINSDVVTDISLTDVYRFHLDHEHPATLVLCDDPEFNTVCVDSNGLIVGFNATAALNTTDAEILTFTGIQVLDPIVLDFMPENQFSSSIDAYQKMINSGFTIAGFLCTSNYWKDLGNPERYMEVVCHNMAPVAFKKAFGQTPFEDITKHPLKGDGSDRKWYRLKSTTSSLVMVDHGIQQDDGISEFDSFVSIGRHLYEKGLPVPEIFLFDRFSGLVFMEDLGNMHLADVVQKKTYKTNILPLYESVVDDIINLSITGSDGFDPSWTYQSASYDRDLILERECRYFVDAFLNGYLKMHVQFEEYVKDFGEIADNAVHFSTHGFMHRDMQSRNIMIKNRQCRFIDFQGGRTGPFQYDLASLLIDPYVKLPFPFQQHLLEYACEKMSTHRPVERQTFFKGYTYCSITRNLQILGAFGFLSRNKGKTWFEQYIPFALKTLKQNLSNLPNSGLDRLKKLVEGLPDL